MDNLNEKILIKYVQRELNSGKTKISIPATLLTNVRDDILVELKRLCKLNSVSVSINT